MRSIVRYQNPRSAGLLPSFGLATSRSPWSGLESELDRLFASAVSSLPWLSGGTQPPVDLYEDKDNTYVRAELPGFEKDSISVEMVNGYLTIRATRQDKSEGDVSVERSVSIPETVRADKVSAAYENGILTVTLPKQEAAKPKKIAVSVA